MTGRSNRADDEKNRFMDTRKLIATALAMVANGKALLALDESTDTCIKVNADAPARYAAWCQEAMILKPKTEAV